MKQKKYVYFFGNGKAAGDPSMKRLLGGKGANLAGMTASGIPVPPGFTISTEVCYYFNRHEKRYPEGLNEQIETALNEVEKATGLQFGDLDNPLLVSVRSGAERSMPGMMDTVLNLGLNSELVEVLARKTNPRMAWDSFRRLIDMFGNVVMGVDHSKFEIELGRIKKDKGVELDADLSVDALKEVCAAYLNVYQREVGEPFPSRPREQLDRAIRAVFESWAKDRAVAYRRINKITGLLGTAVNVQAMVFGNMGQNSGSGVAFTRNPATGDNEFYGEFLINAQGEDVVAGIRTPMHIDGIKEKWPDIYEQLMGIRQRLEQRYRDMQDVEFTIQEGTLYMLQTRTGQRTGMAAVKMAIDMVHEHLISPKEALQRIKGEQLNQLLFPILDPQAKLQALEAGHQLGVGLPAGPGAATGQAVFNSLDAELWKKQGKKVILVRDETVAEDVAGMWAAEGILTSKGGMTSHAAVVARGWGKCCVVGLGELNIDDANKCFTIGGQSVKEGDFISLDGSTGELLLGQVPTTPSPVIAGLLHDDANARDNEVYKNFVEIMDWSDRVRRLKVRANADTPIDAEKAVKLGAQGIGLVRTEHMFFEGERIWAIREFILAQTPQDRQKALNALLPLQEEDFLGIFNAMGERPVTIRLLDPPLHEFLPFDEAGQQEMAHRLGISVAEVKHAVAEHKEQNPMLGHRGCRLSISYPELCVMQTKAIIKAALAVESKFRIEPEIMIPLVASRKEFDFLARIIKVTADELIKQKNSLLRYKVGSMIEIPRAALLADEIAKSAEFFSFGTNDLTQMTLGLSRDDANSFLPNYRDKKIFAFDPFEQIDEDGVGSLMKIAVSKGKSQRPDIHLGICGEHGGEPHSVKFCHDLGLDYVSCSPYRVPIARLAAAQAVLASEDEHADLDVDDL